MPEKKAGVNIRIYCQPCNEAGIRFGGVIQTLYANEAGVFEFPNYLCPRCLKPMFTEPAEAEGEK